MTDITDTDAEPTKAGCKVCRVLAERDMHRYEEDLVAQWTADDGSRMGYRSLATWLNVTILRREMDAAGVSTLGDEAESKYERLTGDDDIVANEVEQALRAEGIEAGRLRDDFVSYGVVRTHLRECLEVERADDDGTTNWERESIEIARDHAESKVTQAVRSLLNKDELESVGDVEVAVDVELEDTETHVRVPVDRAIRRGYVARPNEVDTT